LILLDAYALIALLAGEPAAEEVELILRQGEGASTAVAVAETVDVVQRVRGVSEQDVRGPVELLLNGPLQLAEVRAEHAMRAGTMRARHSRRRASPLSLADCILIACAGKGDGVATADGPLARVARSEGIEVRALPDSRGRRP
jgi:predicted nucleic acid-binding protein